MSEGEQMKLLIWGTGRRAKRYLDKEYFKSHTIVGFVDNDKTRTNFNGKKVYSPKDIQFLDYDYMVVAVKDSEDIFYQSRDLGINMDKFVFPSLKWKPLWNLNEEAMRKISLDWYLDSCEKLDQVTIVNEKDIYDKQKYIGTELFDNPEYLQDYFRYRTFEYMAKEINERKIEGDVAELGVFRAVFSRLINHHFSEKTIYLFDTFEGFSAEEAAKEKEMGRCDDGFIEAHKDTKVELALSNIIHKEKCVVRKGFFPETAKGLEDNRYAFVSIDVDFEKSALEGIRYFYPRLSKGGVIFLHDYNTARLDGIKVAVRTYEEEIGSILRLCPLADRAGTMVIIK